jgi:hypothetical protein
MRYFVVMTLFIAAAAAACGSSSSQKPVAAYTLACKGPSSEILPGMKGDVTAVLTDARGKAVSGKAVRWSVTSASGPGGLERDGDKGVTDIAGLTSTTYLVAFDAGWRGEVTVSAETTDVQPPARCEARFTAISPGMPLPPTTTPRP